MKYEKPEFVVSASSAIRGGLKTDDVQTDSNPSPYFHTIGAYEADE